MYKEVFARVAAQILNPAFCVGRASKCLLPFSVFARELRADPLLRRAPGTHMPLSVSLSWMEIFGAAHWAVSTCLVSYVFSCSFLFFFSPSNLSPVLSFTSLSAFVLSL